MAPKSNTNEPRKISFYKQKKVWLFVSLLLIFTIFRVSENYGHPQGLVLQGISSTNPVIETFNQSNENYELEYGTIKFRAKNDVNNTREDLSRNCEKAKGLKFISRIFLTKQDYQLTLELETPHGHSTKILTAEGCFEKAHSFNLRNEPEISFDENHNLIHFAGKTNLNVRVELKLISERPALTVINQVLNVIGIKELPEGLSPIKTEDISQLLPIISFANVERNQFNYQTKGELNFNFENGISVPFEYELTWKKIAKEMPIINTISDTLDDTSTDTVLPDVSELLDNESTADWSKLCRRANFDIACSVMLLVRHWRIEEPGFITGPYNDNKKISIQNENDTDGRFLVNFAYDSSEKYWFGSPKDDNDEDIRKNIRGVVTPIPHGLGNGNSTFPWFKVKNARRNIYQNKADYVFHAKLQYKHKLLDTQIDKLKIYCTDISYKNGKNCEPFYRIFINVSDREKCSVEGGKYCIIESLKFENINEDIARDIYSKK